MTLKLELGPDTFGDVTAGPDCKFLPQDQVLRDVLEQAVLADEVKIDFIGLGKHHRADFAISAPEVLLGAYRISPQPYTAGDCGDGAVFRRSGAGVPTLLDTQCAVERSGGGHLRSEFLHGKLPAVLL